MNRPPFIINVKLASERLAAPEIVFLFMNSTSAQKKVINVGSSYAVFATVHSFEEACSYVGTINVTATEINLEGKPEVHLLFWLTPS